METKVQPAGPRLNPDNSEDWRIDVQGELRFVLRVAGDIEKPLRILQQYQWCQTHGEFGWYDIPLDD